MSTRKIQKNMGPPNMGNGNIRLPFVVVEYVWLGGKKELRSKVRVIHTKDFKGLKDIPEWNFDGSSTAQAEGVDSDVIIKPRSLFIDPSRPNGFIVMCDTWISDDKPHQTNRRHWANDIFNKNLDAEPWFGIEQEYFLMDKDTGKPLGWYEGMPPQGQYYCSNGTRNAMGREIVEEHMHLCLSAGIKLSGTNAEVAPGQWEYQVGPCTGIDAADQLWLSRFFLIRVAEKHDVIVNFDPKPLSEGDWNGSGCHTNYSTKNMREGVAGKTGLEYINEALEKLGKNHMKHMLVYGEGNKERMTGKFETASYYKFTTGISNRGASIRIGNITFKDKKGYFEDRRPSSNMDPYDVTGIMFETTVLL